MTLIKTFLAIGIAIVFAVFISYGLHVIYKPPESDCYIKYDCSKYFEVCKQYKYTQPEYERCYREVQQSSEYKTCLENRDECEEEFRKREYVYARNSFFILVAIGIIAIVVGSFLKYLEVIGSGLIGGGILIIFWSLIYTYILEEYWPLAYARLIVIGIVLVILIYLGYKKMEKRISK